jgi:hypothetical protein
MLSAMRLRRSDQCNATPRDAIMHFLCPAAVQRFDAIVTALTRKRVRAVRRASAMSYNGASRVAVDRVLR